jgi:transposase
MSTKFDGRKVSHSALEEIRIRAVQQVLDGESPEHVIRVLKMSDRTIYKWLEKYHNGGFEALRAKPVPGRPPKLGASQLAWLSKTIRGNNPLQLSFEFALWTLPMIRELIKRKYKVSLSEVSVGRILKTLGFSPQRPLHRAWQQDPVLVQNWLNKEFPRIREEARKARAQIYFGDESSIRSDYHAGTTWAPLGETPIVKSTGRRFSLNMLSAISPQGHLRFMIVDGSVGAQTFCEFLRRLVKGVRKQIFLVLDNHPIHRSKRVKKLIEELDGKLKLFFLPPYSPELNPDELVWGHVKNKVGRRALSSKGEMSSTLVGSLRSLQKRPEIVKGFFQHADCRYAAAG